MKFHFLSTLYIAATATAETSLEPVDEIQPNSNADKPSKTLGPDRAPSALNWFLGPRVGVFAVVASQPSSPIATGGIEGSIQFERYFLESALYFLIPISGVPTREYEKMTTRYGGGCLEVGGGYFLGSGNFAPYIGGGILPRLFGGDPVTWNLAFYGRVGVIFQRRSSFQVPVEFRIVKSVLPIWGASSDYGSLSNYYPTEIGVNLGIAL